MTGNRARIHLTPLDSDPVLRMIRTTLPHHLRDRPICQIERGADRGWLIRTNVGLWAMLLAGGVIQTVPQHKIRPALEAAGIVHDPD